jgi:hypothetical protein
VYVFEGLAPGAAYAVWANPMCIQSVEGVSVVKTGCSGESRKHQGAHLLWLFCCVIPARCGARVRHAYRVTRLISLTLPQCFYHFQYAIICIFLACCYHTQILDSLLHLDVLIAPFQDTRGSNSPVLLPQSGSSHRCGQQHHPRTRIHHCPARIKSWPIVDNKESK